MTLLKFVCILLLGTPIITSDAKLYPNIRACLTLSNVHCPCGTSGKMVPTMAEDCVMVDAEQAAGRCEPCDPRMFPPVDPCRNFSMCATCDPVTRSCSSCSPGSAGRFCEMPSGKEPVNYDNDYGVYSSDMNGNYLGQYNQPVPAEQLYGAGVPHGGIPSGGHYGEQQGYMAGPRAPMGNSYYGEAGADYSDLGANHEGYSDYSGGMSKLHGDTLHGGAGYHGFPGAMAKRDIPDDLTAEDVMQSLSFFPPVAVVRAEKHSGDFAKRSVRSNVYPIEVVIPAGENISKNRHVRSASECFFPDHMDTAEIRCTIWPTYTKCNVTCIWGHTLQAGRTVTIKCRNRENTWKPYGFKECDPYVDCSLKLKSPGSVNCVYNRLNDPIDCDIMCNEYDDIPAAPKKAYACTLQGAFDPALPFCVDKANTTITVPPPAWR